MANSNAYNAVLAKARAMYGKHITPEQYQEMLRCHSVQEVAAFLKNQTHYGEMLSNVSEHNIHRGQLENLLRKAAFEQCGKLYHYLPLTRNDLFQVVIRQEEISELLRMVLLMRAGNAKSFILELPGYLIQRAEIDLMAVARATKFDELIYAVRGSEYAAILKRFAPSDEKGQINYIGCEHAFYEYFYRKTFAMINKNYKGQAKTQLLELVKVDIELKNLEHVFRCKRYLNASPEDIVRSLYPYYYKIHAEQLQEMVEAKDEHTLDDLFSKTKYHTKFEQTQLPFIEDYTKRYYYSLCKRYLHFSPYVSVVFYAYFHLNQVELNNIVNVIEGIRYGLPENEIKELLVM
ncbi:V-type ATPase subunit [Massilimaliae timonensis]|uniref:V-type ATPase subunit n=1 Tax=Massiliimalia timonensis TaxID=1987501 RepID=A0A8J6TQE7_9FIRM|nr:V-type ATPase subunit [Massiliimalia timonensis]MBC8611079.1 V-type ATPase subunit [Massiliimalia timonensis]